MCGLLGLGKHLDWLSGAGRQEFSALGLLVFAAIIATATAIFRRIRQAGQEADEAAYAVTAPAGRLEPYEDGESLVMGFRRQRFTWTADHTPGQDFASWEHCTDVADAIFQSSSNAEDKGKCFATGYCSLEKFEESLPELIGSDPPTWLDLELLDEGCRFFVQLWPVVFVSFSWAVMGGFGSESASAVLLRSRYWAHAGENGRLDTWNRFLETACWLHDMCAHGSASFQPGGVAWRACVHVRYLHCRTRAQILRTGGWDSKTHGQPINQCQLVGTLLGSSILLLQGMEELAGCKLPSRKKEGFVHLWRIIGYLFGIDDSMNPNTSVKNATIAMESLFAFGIAAEPSSDLSGKLVRHVCESVAEGTKAQLKAGRLATVGLVAAPGWIFLGPSYGRALGLPPSSTLELLLARTRLLGLHFMLRFYIHVPFADRMLQNINGWAFAKAVGIIRSSQPRCRFGVLPAAGCPMKQRKQR